MNVSSTNISWFEVANFGDLFIYINSYKIYLNGLIEQWGKKAYASGTDTIPLLINFTNTNYDVKLIGLDTNVDSNSNTVCIKSRAENQFVFMTFGRVGADSGYLWKTTGY